MICSLLETKDDVYCCLKKSCTLVILLIPIIVSIIILVMSFAMILSEFHILYLKMNS